MRRTLMPAWTAVLCASSLYAQAGWTPKACRILSIPDLEAHFGAKAATPRGADLPTVSTCHVDIPDHLHGVDVISYPSKPSESTVDQRLTAIRPMLEKKGSRIKSFGSTACFTDQMDLSSVKLPTATCFLVDKGYLSLTLHSDNPKGLGFEVVKSLLEKAAARRR